AIILENFQDFFAFPEGVKEHRHCTDIEGVRSKPQQVASDAVQLRHKDSDVLRTRRRRDAEHLLDRFAESQAIRNGRDVIHAVERWYELAVGLMFAEFLNAAMEVTDDAFRVNDALAIQLQLYLQHTVCGRMLRTHADGQ